MKKTTELFISEAQQIHGDEYDYSSVVYTNNKTKITIICKIHGAFLQAPYLHLFSKTGCPVCAIAKRHTTNLKRYGQGQKPLSAESNNKRRATNLERYGVDEVTTSIEWKANREKAMLKAHGVAHPMQSPAILSKRIDHNMSKYGVPSPKQKHMVGILPLLTDQNWLTEQYIGLLKSAEQIADEIGVERTTVLNYLAAANIPVRTWCPQSAKCINWLSSIMKSHNIHIQHALNGGEYKIPKSKLSGDGYCKDTNTIYEFYGDYWHGNPRVFNSATYNTQKHKTMGELYVDTIHREQLILALGYNLVTMWESDFISV